jgi:RAQPRD family integrative conjugative element protein
MKHWMTLLLVIGLAAGKPAWAEPEWERSELAGLVKEIDFLLQRVEAIQTRMADHAGRLRFQYPDLRRDLERMREGIADYIEADLQVGRTFTPLHGRYR